MHIVTSIIIILKIGLIRPEKCSLFLNKKNLQNPTVLKGVRDFPVRHVFVLKNASAPTHLRTTYEGACIKLTVSTY